MYASVAAKKRFSSYQCAGEQDYSINPEASYDSTKAACTTDHKET